jgi:hypothetical protein
MSPNNKQLQEEEKEFLGKRACPCADRNGVIAGPGLFSQKIVLASVPNSNYSFYAKGFGVTFQM